MSKYVAKKSDTCVLQIELRRDDYLCEGHYEVAHPWTCVGQPLKSDGSLIDVEPPSGCVTWDSEEDVWVVDASSEMCGLRRLRDSKIDETQWLVNRHNREVALGRTTSITSEQFSELLNWHQALCDEPQRCGEDPEEWVWPVEPSFVVYKAL